MGRLEELQRTVSSLSRGTSFVRYAMALARAKGDTGQAAITSAAMWRDSPDVAAVLKSAADAGTTTDATWASTLAPMRSMMSEFAEILKPLTILGRLNTRRVPFNISYPAQTGSGATVSWLGQGQAAPVSELAFQLDTLGTAKAGGVIVLANELVRSSAPSAEAIVRSELLAAMSKFLDTQFISPSVAAVLDVSPASILHGLTPVASSGTTASAIAVDIAALFEKLNTAGVNLISPALIMRPSTAVAIGLKRDTAGGSAFPTITAKGGTLMGVDVITSANVPSSVSGGSIIALVDGAEIEHADDGVTTLDSSEEASLQMRDDPQSGAQNLVSLWQMNLAAIRAIRYANWRLRHAGAAGYVDAVFY